MKIFLPFVLLSLLAAGCVTHMEPIRGREPINPTQPVPANVPSDSGKPMADPRVLIDPSLKNIISLVKVRSSFSPEGYLKIQLNVKNLTDSFKQFRYRIDWLDDKGNSLSLADATPLEWTLLKGETSFLGATSPTPAARDFRVTFAPN